MTLLTVLLMCTDTDDSKPRLLWSLYFNVNNTSRCDLSTNVDNIIVIGGPDDSIDYDIAVVEVLYCLNHCS